MLCVNYCICIKKVLHGWFYPLQMDYFLTHDRNNSFHLLFYRSLCYSVYVYIHNTFLWEKITWFFFLDRMIPISLKKLCLKGGLELWWFFISYGIKTVLWQLRQSNCCSKIAQMSSELLSDRSNRLKSSCEVLNFHSIIWSVVMEGVSGDKSQVSCKHWFPSHLSMYIICSFKIRQGTHRSFSSKISLSFVKIQLFWLWFLSSLLKKSGTTELKDEICSAWHKICRVKMNFISTFVAPISVLKLFSIVVASN